MLPLGALHCVATFFFTFALQYDLAPHISGLKRLAVIFQMVLAYWLLNQRSDIRKRIIGGIGVVAGVILIAIPNTFLVISPKLNLIVTANRRCIWFPDYPSYDVFIVIISPATVCTVTVLTTVTWIEIVCVAAATYS